MNHLTISFQLSPRQPSVTVSLMTPNPENHVHLPWQTYMRYPTLGCSLLSFELLAGRYMQGMATRCSKCQSFDRLADMASDSQLGLRPGRVSSRSQPVPATSALGCLHQLCETISDSVSWSRKAGQHRQPRQRGCWHKPCAGCVAPELFPQIAVGPELPQEESRGSSANAWTRSQVVVPLEVLLEAQGQFLKTVSPFRVQVLN